MAFLLHLLRPQDLFVDVGANVGSYTVLAGKAIGARVLCFEPVPRTFAKLRDNIALNAISSRVDARQACVGKATGTVHITTGLDTMNHITDGPNEADGPTMSVPLVSLDDALAGDAPRLIKVDVEGHELDVLAGAQRTLADPRLQALIIEVNDNHAGPQGALHTLRSLLGAHGFESMTYAPFERALSASTAETARANAIFVRDRDAVSERLRSAPAFSVLQRSV